MQKVAWKTLVGLFYAVVGGVAAFLLTPVFNGWRGEITVYPLLTHSTEARPSPGNRTTFRVYPETQTVVEWMPGINGVSRLKNCSVRDRKNWECEVDGPAFKYVMHDGDFAWYENGKRAPDRFVGRMEWFKAYVRVLM
jgi:hypothetical protein